MQIFKLNSGESVYREIFYDFDGSFCYRWCCSVDSKQCSKVYRGDEDQFWKYIQMRNEGLEVTQEDLKIEEEVVEENSQMKDFHPSLDYAWDLYKKYVECDKSCPDSYALYLQAVIQMCSMIQVFVTNVREDDREEVVLSLANVLDIAARREK